MNVRRLRMVAVILLVSAGMVLTACAGATPTPPIGAGEGIEDLPALSAVPLSEGEKLRVGATTNIVADVVSNIGGDKIALKGLLPVGADPHAYEPTPQDLRAVANAHVIFANGAGLETFLDEMIRNAGGDAPVISLSHGVQLREFGSSAAGEHDHVEGADSHTWFDPNNVIIWAHNAEQALSALDPANTDVYKANAQTYVTRLETLDTWIREQVAQIPEDRRKIVTDHLVLGYFAHEYGFEYIGAVIEAYSAAAEPSAQALVALENNVRKVGVPAVFVGKTVNPKLAARVAEDTGIKLVPLYTGSLSEPGGEADTYINFMRYDVSAIVEALR